MAQVTSQDWVKAIRMDFPTLQNCYDNQPPVYFDNACTTLVPQPVVSSITEYYNKYAACGGWRSRHHFAQEVRARIEGDEGAGIQGSRRKIQEFINAGSWHEIIFTYNTTFSINLVALGFNFQPGDVVLISDHEHNSNLIPWLRLQAKGLIKLEYLKSLPDYQFDLEGLEHRLSQGQVRLVSLAYTSNLTGYTMSAAKIIEIAHHYGARVLLDGAQTIPHLKVDVQALDVDFLAFSLHKMCGPRGVGILYAKTSLLEGKSNHHDRLEPVILGGGTIHDATYDSYDLLDSPEKYEAGIQNYPGQIAAGAAIDYLNQVSLQRIQEQEYQLNSFLTSQLRSRYENLGWFNILGPRDPADRGSMLTFEVKMPNAVGISDELSQRSNIMIRDGAFCVHSYLNSIFGKGWTEPNLPSQHRMTYRCSLYFYNTLEECTLFLKTLDEIFQDRGYI